MWDECAYCGDKIKGGMWISDEEKNIYHKRCWIKKQWGL